MGPFIYDIRNFYAIFDPCLCRYFFYCLSANHEIWMLPSNVPCLCKTSLSHCFWVSSLEILHPKFYNRQGCFFLMACNHSPQNRTSVTLPYKESNPKWKDPQPAIMARISNFCPKTMRYFLKNILDLKNFMSNVFGISPVNICNKTKFE